MPAEKIQVFDYFLKLLVLAIFFSPVGDNSTVFAQMPPILQEDSLVTFSADQMTFDRKNKIITAFGKVEVFHEGRVMYADDISYDQNTDVLKAAGNISILEPNGEVIFAENLEVTGDMKDGIIEDIGLILTDKSRLAASGARRSNANILELRNAVYSPCNLCEEDPNSPPLWQLRAVRIIHDKSKQRIEYRDAVLEVLQVGSRMHLGGHTKLQKNCWMKKHFSTCRSISRTSMSILMMARPKS